MTHASDNSPSKGECVSDVSFDYRQVAETLLSAELERVGFGLRSSFLDTAQKVSRGEEIDESDVEELKAELHTARMLVEAIEDGLE